MVADPNSEKMMAAPEPLSPASGPRPIAPPPQRVQARAPLPPAGRTALPPVPRNTLSRPPMRVLVPLQNAISTLPPPPARDSSRPPAQALHAVPASRPLPERAGPPALRPPMADSVDSTLRANTIRVAIKDAFVDGMPVVMKRLETGEPVPAGTIEAMIVLTGEMACRKIPTTNPTLGYGAFERWARRCGIMMRLQGRRALRRLGWPA